MTSNNNNSNNVSPSKRGFSERLGAMKFMKRKEETKLRARLENEEKKKLAEWQWHVPQSMLPPSLRHHDDDDDGETHTAVNGVVVEYESPWVDESESIRLLMRGRRSFCKFNKSIDATQVQLSGDANRVSAIADEVNDEEMADRVTTYVGIDRQTSKHRRSKSSSNSRNRHDNKKPRFQKPQNLI